jgi:hypothetical protein
MHDILLTDEFINEIRNSKGTQYGLLPSYAKHPERFFGPGIEQINRIWAALPEKMRNNKDLRQRIRHYQDETTFWGGFSEALVAYLLQDSGHDFEYSPEINRQKPDFSVEIERQRYLIDVFASSGDGELDKCWEKHRLLREELSKLNSPICIYLTELTPNDQGNFHGIARALDQYLRTIVNSDDDADRKHTVEARGARLIFTIQQKDQGPIDFVGPRYPGGMPKPEIVREGIAKKAKKYSSNPLIVVYFCTTPIAKPARILFEALDGTPVFRAAGGNTPGSVETWWESSGKGIWGAHNGFADKYPHLQGVVAVTVVYTKDLMEFRVAKAISSGAKGWTHGVPVLCSGCLHARGIRQDRCSCVEAVKPFSCLTHRSNHRPSTPCHKKKTLWSDVTH